MQNENVFYITNKFNDLTDEQIVSLIKQGDEKAREEFINGNLRLVLSVIQRFRRKRGKSR